MYFYLWLTVQYIKTSECLPERSYAYIMLSAVLSIFFFVAKRREKWEEGEKILVHFPETSPSFWTFSDNENLVDWNIFGY